MRNLGDADPDQQGLDELKATNPEAFSIVNALLTKRSLGMLNTRHPSASFAPNADAAPQHDGPSALDVLKASEPQRAPSASVEAPVEVPVSEVSMSVPRSHHAGGWLNWKPHNDDEDMVNSVLGAVAELKNGNSAPLQQEQRAPAPPVQEQPVAAPPVVEQPVAVPAAVTNTAPTFQEQPAVQQNVHRLGALSFDWGNRYASSQQASTEASATPQWSTSRATPPQQAQAPTDNNPYLKGIDFSSDLGAPIAKASMSQQNSYLRGSGLESAPAHTIEKDNGVNKLTSFSWYDSGNSDSAKTDTGYLQQSGEDAKPVEAKPVDVQPGDNLVNGALAGWLNH